MKRFTSIKNLGCGVVIVAFAVLTAIGQAPQPKSPTSKPLLQDIQVEESDSGPAAAPPSLIKRTSSVRPSGDIVLGSSAAAGAIRSSYPILANTAIPGYSGVLVETLDGKVIVDSGSNIALNPASNVKIATTYAVLKTFGPNYRFATNVWTDGSYDEASKTIYGNIYIAGRDPVFGYEHAVMVAHELNRIGVRSVVGDLIVTDSFAMNYSGSPQRAGQTLFATLDASKRNAAANRIWSSYLINTGKTPQSVGIPSVTFSGGLYVQSMPSSVKLLLTHQSAPLREIVKAMMSYSNNFVSERLGDTVGGPYAVARLVQQNIGVTPAEFSLQTASGLGINRVTASAMMKLLRELRGDLAKNRMTFADVMPVAGMDKGTLENRFDTDFSAGSVIGKTGTLGNTDGGVSALAGEINTRSGTLLFVIFNQRGSVSRFRSFQNNYVSLIQGQFGGAAPIGYTALSLDARLAKNKVVYPVKSGVVND